MKATYRGGRIGSAAHNDRSYRDGNREGVQVLFRGYRVGPGERLEDLERDWYRQRYGAAVEAQNERHRAARHPERCRTTDDLYTGPRTRPYEVILQVGDRNDVYHGPAFKRAVTELLRALDKGNVTVLSSCLHEDETTPHIHLRLAIDIHTADGFKLAQEKGLQAMGVELPDETKPPGRYNNRLMTWTMKCRALWIEKLREQGLSVSEPEPCRRRHTSSREYWRSETSRTMSDRYHDLER